MKRIWIFICLAVCCAVLAALSPFYLPVNSRVLLVKDAFDPMFSLLEPYAGKSMERLDPYRLGYELPGLNGMAFVSGTQARPYQQKNSLSDYVPLYNATVVIAVNRKGNSVGSIDGWHTLLDSEAMVLIPHNATEGGRLAAIALARALGAQEGDLAPAVDAYKYLMSQNRLNQQSEYAFAEFSRMYHPDRLISFDAVVMWDYQARTLARFSDDWEIIVPAEGTLSVDCGFVYGSSVHTCENVSRTKEFLLSEQGRQALWDAGFSPLAGETDLSAWDSARLTYNPGFRRGVLSVKLYTPASVRERMLLGSLTLLLFCIAAQRILRRVPRGLYRSTSLYALLFVLLWMLTGIMKTVTLGLEPTRYFWFASYISRHALPVLWYCMCHLNAHERLPSLKQLIPLGLVAFLLTVFVLTNDYHNQVFVYAHAEPETWEYQYSNGWGYYLSLFWSLSLSIAGLTMLFRWKPTRQQKRQFIYAGIFFVILGAYQFSYMAGVQSVIDLDIPTTVAIFILIFILAAQRERFMGASLFSLPIFLHSPYAIAVYDAAGQTVYRNDVMKAVEQGDTHTPAFAHGQYKESAEIMSGKAVFKPHVYTFENGRALILEDITDLKRLERSLQQIHTRLDAVRKLLVRRVEETRTLTVKLEKERYSMQMELLLKEKLEEARRMLSRIPDGTAKDQADVLLRRVRFLICICHQRLRFIIRSMEAHPLSPAQLVERYVAGVIKNGQRIGLDGVLTASCRGCCPPGIIPVLLEALDSIFLFAFDLPGSSLICRMEAHEAGITFNALLSWEGDMPLAQDAMLPENLVDTISGLGGQVYQKTDEDGLLTRLHFPYEEAAK